LQRELDQINANISSEQTAIRTSQEQGKVVVADLFRLTLAMPDRPGVAEAASTLNMLAERSGIRLDSITPGDATDKTGFRLQPFDVTFHGSFYQLAEFLNQLRSLVIVRNGQLDARGRLFVVDSIAFSPGEEGKFDKLAAVLKINAFIYGAGAAAPATTTPTPAEGTSTTAGETVTP
jgi:Tfp pilus assembly protein PilO